MLNPYAVEPGVCCHQQCPRLHLCFATACYQTAGRSISRGRIHGIFGFHAASSHINYLQECAAFHLLSTSYQVCSGVTLLREFYTAIRVAQGKALTFVSAFSPGPHRTGTFQRIRRTLLLCEDSPIPKGSLAQQANDIFTINLFARNQ